MGLPPETRLWMLSEVRGHVMGRKEKPGGDGASPWQTSLATWRG